MSSIARTAATKISNSGRNTIRASNLLLFAFPRPIATGTQTADFATLYQKPQTLSRSGIASTQTGLSTVRSLLSNFKDYTTLQQESKGKVQKALDDLVDLHSRRLDTAEAPSDESLNRLNIDPVPSALRTEYLSSAEFDGTEGHLAKLLKAHQTQLDLELKASDLLIASRPRGLVPQSEETTRRNLGKWQEGSELRELTVSVKESCDGAIEALKAAESP